FNLSRFFFVESLDHLFEFTSPFPELFFFAPFIFKLRHRNVPTPQPVQLESGNGQAEQGGRKLLSATRLDLPLLDDDDDRDTLVLTKKTGTLNGSSLITGILGLD
ncbi:MAG: hypothetical protein K8I30_01175, partial [Anaerolineae bacterium]|nr:hypothetical protein [Anaerolineae bacterium]